MHFFSIQKRIIWKIAPMRWTRIRSLCNYAFIRQFYSAPREKKLIAYASKLQTMNVKKKLIFEQNSSKSFNFVANFWWFYYIIHRNFQWDEEKKMLGVWCSQKLCSLITFRLFLYALTEIYAHNKIPWPKLYAYELVCIFRLAKKKQSTSFRLRTVVELHFFLFTDLA